MNKQKARERDDYTCQRCGFRSESPKTHAHHIIPAKYYDTPEEAHNLDNLITVCDKCHGIIEKSLIRELIDRSLKLDSLISTPEHISTYQLVKGICKKNDETPA